MQTIPQTFKANKHPGHGDIMNGYDNLLAALKYAKNKYGKNLSFLGKGHGYANGGIVDKEHTARVAEGNKKEAIVPMDRSKRGRALDILSRVSDEFGLEPETAVVNGNSGDNKGIEEMLGKILQAITAQAGLKQEVNINSPEPTSASENARQLKKTMQKMGVGL